MVAWNIKDLRKPFSEVRQGVADRLNAVRYVSRNYESIVSVSGPREAADKWPVLSEVGMGVRDRVDSHGTDSWLREAVNQARMHGAFLRWPGLPFGGAAFSISRQWNQREQLRRTVVNESPG